MLALLIIHSPYKRVKRNLIYVTNFSFLVQSVGLLAAATIQVVSILKKNKKTITKKTPYLWQCFFSFLKSPRKSLLFTFMRNGDLYQLEWGVPSLQRGIETNISFACKIDTGLAFGGSVQYPRPKCASVIWIWSRNSYSKTLPWVCLPSRKSDAPLDRKWLFFAQTQRAKPW